MSGKTAPLPERKRSYRIALTPLADAMFQLLIFFMLTTSLTPYSLITIRTGGDAAAQDTEALAGGPGPSQQNGNDGESITIWTLNEGTVTSRGQEYDIGQLVALADALSATDDAASVVIVVGPTARMQDVASAMEALSRADVTSVQITREGE